MRKLTLDPIAEGIEIVTNCTLVDAHDHSPGRGRSVGAYARPKISDEEVFQAKLRKLERFRAPTSDFDYKLGALEHTKDRFSYELEMMS